jgi:hypothetical protein
LSSNLGGWMGWSYIDFLKFTLGIGAVHKPCDAILAQVPAHPPMSITPNTKCDAIWKLVRSLFIFEMLFKN